MLKYEITLENICNVPFLKELIIRIFFLNIYIQNLFYI